MRLRGTEEDYGLVPRGGDGSAPIRLDGAPDTMIVDGLGDSRMRVERSVRSLFSAPDKAGHSCAKISS